MAVRAGDAQLETVWAQPPLDARIRAYWWWINGNVTREAITRDLEQMQAKGFGGALLCDADGSNQDGNARAPHGSTFFSPEWRELYKHTLREADRLGLEISLNIQSGWNLGGPMVTPDDAPKKLVWTETRVSHGTNRIRLSEPRGRDNYYRDLFVLAYPIKPIAIEAEVGPAIRSSSAQAGHEAAQAQDRNAQTFWVSEGSTPGGGPTRDRPQWIELSFPKPVSVSRLTLTGRPGYGPRECELQSINANGEAKPVQSFTAERDRETLVQFPEVTSRVFRIAFYGAFDPHSPGAPRNVQVAEVRLNSGAADGRRPLRNQQQKALLDVLRPFSAPDSSPLFQEFPALPGEEDAAHTGVIDLTGKMTADGVLEWTVPEGAWHILRLGCTLNDHCRVSTCSEGWDGYALDPFDAGAFKRYWDAVVEPLIDDAGPLAGKALKYLHTDSWEVEVANWTPTLREEFRKRRGYDLLPWLPVIAGKIINSREESNRFLNDFRRTMGDLAIDNHYRLFRDGAHRRGLLIHPESGGPHAVPIDAQQCLGFNDAPMSEFWAWSWRHRMGDQNRFFVKQPASAAHAYGRKLVLAEGFTTIGPHWQETLWDNLKPSFDYACTEGLNLLVWHAFVCSPASEGIPGQQYFAGTHLNPNVTWWEKSRPFFSYINRCQALLQEGLPVSDVAYYYGDHVPNFTQLRKSDPARVGFGYDYDVLTEEVILTRLSVKDGRLMLPDGVSYRMLMLPDRDIISLPVLRKIRELVSQGAVVAGTRPRRATSLTDYPRNDTEVERLAAELWNESRTPNRVRNSTEARAILLAEGVKPDFEILSPGTPPPDVSFIHRSTGDAEIYFVANRSTNAVTFDGVFRVARKAAELWDPVTGARRFVAAAASDDGRTAVRLELEPCGSTFVVFRSSAAAPTDVRRPTSRPIGTVTGPWQVSFDPNWGGPGKVEFSELSSWPIRPEPGIRFYSGTAVYARTVEAPTEWQAGSGTRLVLDLGQVRELAEVKVNGQSCGITWIPPFQVDVTAAIKPGTNQLEIEVVNFWPNRIIGDASLPADQQRTRTNIRKLTANTPLMPSGLMGPVQWRLRSE
jgi:hypothetical protein